MALPSFVTDRNIRVAVVVLCGMLFVLGLFVLIALALSSSSTGGRCLLYSDRKGFGPGSACTYVYVIIVFFQFVYCVARALPTALIVSGVLQQEDLLKKQVTLYGSSVVDAIACVLILVCGGIISHGFSTMCSGVFHPHEDRCGSVDIYSEATHTFIRHYYTRLNIAQVSIWLSWVSWILLLALDVLQLWKADLLSNLSQHCPGSLCPRRASSDTISRDRDTNQSQRSTVTFLFRPGESDTESAPRTPPPTRPVPPRPAVISGGGGGRGGGRGRGGRARGGDNGRSKMEKY